MQPGNIFNRNLPLFGAFPGKYSRVHQRFNNQYNRFLEVYMFGFSMPALMVVLAIILVVFGARRLPEIGSAFGKGIRNFKKATDETDEIEINPTDGNKKC
jgi:sec-independent protein translocase protein TatA